jgi:hypothetical protein
LQRDLPAFSVLRTRPGLQLLPLLLPVLLVLPLLLLQPLLPVVQQLIDFWLDVEHARVANLTIAYVWGASAEPAVSHLCILQWKGVWRVKVLLLLLWVLWILCLLHRRCHMWMLLVFSGVNRL